MNWQPPTQTRRTRLVLLWWDFRVWLDEKLHDGQPTKWKDIRR